MLPSVMQHHSEHVQGSLPPALMLVGQVGQQELQVLLQPLLACTTRRRKQQWDGTEGMGLQMLLRQRPAHQWGRRGGGKQHVQCA